MSEPQGRGGAWTTGARPGNEEAPGSHRLSGAPEANRQADSGAPRTLAEKVWDAHVVRSADGEPDLLYIDLHLVHEVTSPQAFDGLRAAGRPVRRPDLTIATEDHNIPDRSDVDQPDRRPDLPHADRDAAQERRGVRRPPVPAGRRRAGHRARRSARSSA